LNVRGTFAVLALSWPLLTSGGAAAGDLQQSMQSEIDIAWTSLQKATENIGCIVTASGENGPKIVRMLDVLNDGEVRLREARRIAQSAATDTDRLEAIGHAKASLALVREAESLSNETETN
jgi:hypothetical protein